VRGDDFRDPAARLAYFEEMQRRLEAVPGVSSVSATSFEPPILPGVFGAVRLSLPGAPETEAASPSAVSRIVMPDFFETMGIPVRAGRGVTRDDVAKGRRVAVISERMAERYFAGRNPLGESFSVHGPRPQPLEIVGVVGDVLTGGTDPAPVPTFYTPYAQSPLAVMSFVLRVPQGDALAPARDAERVAWSLSRDVNVFAIETLDRRLADVNWPTRVGALMLGVFASLALVLGAAGIYAVVSYTVFQRRSEIGLRMALGARAGQVRAMVLRGGLRLALLGVASGVAVSFLVTRALAGFLYGVAPGDPATLAAVALLLVAVAAVSSLPPALRASRVDPQVALRE
jgi:putative ABC transport system permease protein